MVISEIMTIDTSWRKYIFIDVEVSLAVTAEQMDGKNLLVCK